MPGNTTQITDPIGAELKQILRHLKLGRMLDTLPRLALARQQKPGHAEFLELVLADDAGGQTRQTALCLARGGARGRTGVVPGAG